MKRSIGWFLALCGMFLAVLCGCSTTVDTQTQGVATEPQGTPDAGEAGGGGATASTTAPSATTAQTSGAGGSNEGCAADCNTWDPALSQACAAHDPSRPKGLALCCNEDPIFDGTIKANCDPTSTPGAWCCP